MGMDTRISMHGFPRKSAFRWEDAPKRPTRWLLRGEVSEIVDKKQTDQMGGGGGRTETDSGATADQRWKMENMKSRLGRVIGGRGAQTMMHSYKY